MSFNIDIDALTENISDWPPTQSSKLDLERHVEVI